MLARHRYAAILTVLAAAVALVVVQPARQAEAAAVRVMPLGDSITGSPGCWRAVLWNRLQAEGFTDVDFVGTLGPQGCGVPYDGDNEGHGGLLVTNVASQNLLPGWLSATLPDIVMMHFGTNDVWNAIPPAVILAAYTKLVDQMRASNPNMRVLVAKIIPMNPGTCAECGQRVVALNDAIPAWAAATSTPSSPVVVVDQWTGFSTATDTIDGVHPNAAGDRKMADRWFPALSAQLGAVPPATPPATPPGPGGCTATYQVVNQWTGGFQAEVSVRNTATAPISGWTVRFALGAGQQVTQSWNATLTQSGSDVTASNAGWNGALAPGGSAVFGLLGGGTGAPTLPATTCTVR